MFLSGASRANKAEVLLASFLMTTWENTLEGGTCEGPCRQTPKGLWSVMGVGLSKACV